MSSSGINQPSIHMAGNCDMDDHNHVLHCFTAPHPVLRWCQPWPHGFFQVPGANFRFLGHLASLSTPSNLCYGKSPCLVEEQLGTGSFPLLCLPKGTARTPPLNIVRCCLTPWQNDGKDGDSRSLNLVAKSFWQWFLTMVETMVYQISSWSWDLSIFKQFWRS